MVIRRFMIDVDEGGFLATPQPDAVGGARVHLRPTTAGLRGTDEAGLLVRRGPVRAAVQHLRRQFPTARLRVRRFPRRETLAQMFPTV